MTKEHSLALKIAEMCGVKDDDVIIDIERVLLHALHDEWKEGYSRCAQTVNREIDIVLGKKTETE